MRFREGIMLAAGLAGLAACATAGDQAASIAGAAPSAAVAGGVFNAEAFPTSATPVLRDGFPRAEVSFPGGVTAFPGLIYAQPPGYRPNTLDVYMPASVKSGNLPLVVYIHGGGWVSGHTRHSGTFSDWPGVLAGIAEHGYVVASLNYRLTGEAPSPAAIHDVKSAVKWLRANAETYGIDGSKVMTFGGSAGGQLAALAATSCGVAELSPPKEAMALPGVTDDASAQSDCVQGGAIWYGVFDFAPLVAAAAPAANPNAYLDCTPGACSSEAVRNASAAAHVTDDDPPFLLVHGANDRVVLADQSRSFADVLKAKGVDVTLDIIPDVDHSFVGTTPEATRAASLRALSETVAFFDRVSGKGS